MFSIEPSLQCSCLESPMSGGTCQAAVHGVSKSRTRLSDFTFTFPFHALEKEMATHSSVLAWRIPGWGSLVGCHRWGHTESDTTEATQQQWQKQHQFTFPPTVQEYSLFSTPSTAFIICRHFDDSHSDQCEVIPHYSFDLSYSNNSSINHFFMCLDICMSFFREMPLLNLCPLFVCFGVCWVFIALCRLSLVEMSRSHSLLQRVGCSVQWLLLLWSTGSRCASLSSLAHGFRSCSLWALGYMGFSSYGMWALKQGLSRCGSWCQLLSGVWNLPRPGIEPVSPVLAGRFLSTVIPGNPDLCPFFD